MVKTRLQKQRGTTNLRYTGPIHCVRTIVMEEGVRALWNGALPTVLRQATNQAFNFMAFAWLNRVIWDKMDGDGKTLDSWKTLVTGLVAGAMGPCANCPLDVVKTRMMGQEAKKGQEVKYKGFVHCLTTVAKVRPLPCRAPAAAACCLPACQPASQPASHPASQPASCSPPPAPASRRRRAWRRCGRASRRGSCGWRRAKPSRGPW